jgi:hypothetical protein
MALLQKAYLGATPLFRNTAWFEDDDFTVVNESSSVTVTADNTAHVKGAWEPLISSTASDGTVLEIIASAGQTTLDTSALLDIGAGASGSEAALISNIAIGGSRTNLTEQFAFSVPIQIPAGTRISARIQSVISGGRTAVIRCNVYDTGDYAQTPSSVDVIGTDTATSTGTSFSAANSYVPLTSSTSQAYRAIVMLPNVSGSATLNVATTLTLAQGASGSEVELGKRRCHFGLSESVVIHQDPLVVASVASGTRLAVKIEGPTSNLANHGVCLIGIP